MHIIRLDILNTLEVLHSIRLLNSWWISWNHNIHSKYTFKTQWTLSTSAKEWWYFSGQNPGKLIRMRPRRNNYLRHGQPRSTLVRSTDFLEPVMVSAWWFCCVLSHVHFFLRNIHFLSSSVCDRSNWNNLTLNDRQPCIFRRLIAVKRDLRAT